MAITKKGIINSEDINNLQNSYTKSGVLASCAFGAKEILFVSSETNSISIVEPIGSNSNHKALSISGKSWHASVNTDGSLEFTYSSSGGGSLLYSVEEV